MLQNFSYLAPETLKDLYAVLKKGNGKVTILAGGTDLLVNMHNNWISPECLVDIKKIADLKGISFNPKTGLSIGATTVCIDLINNKDVKKHYPLLAEAAHHIGSPQLRNRATIAGNLCTASPCADMGCSLLALGASVELGSTSGTRVIALKDFFTGPKKTQIKKDEVLLRILVPADMAGARSGMRKLKRIKGHDIAVASVAIARTAKVMRIGVGSAAPTPVVTADLAPSITLDKAVAATEKVISPIDDVRAGAEYRRFMVKDFVEQIFAEIC
ncbi:MAG: xanthine dehydrogenase family protein subunit M [Candidatus Riflebacteria bacterium]|nr:xanthine dehydrogenase family protein subunit M [Candidatus Riflebacteria bacterium]